MKNNKYRFIDLFAGLGGFHYALSSLGCECVFASELKDDLRRLYEVNHTVNGVITGDITKYDFSRIPQHDILCAGFPCQPFSQAGKRQGFDDEEGRGNLFNYICKIIEAQGELKPKYLLLENVANLEGHDNGNTWKVIEKKLIDLGYQVDKIILSPHQFGIPQHRKRIYIVGAREDQGGLLTFHFPTPTNEECDIKSILDEKDTEIQPLSLKTIMQLKVWQSFLDECKMRNVTVPSFPIWAMEFGCTYPYETIAPAFNSKSSLNGTKGKLGCKINGNNIPECLSYLPVYSKTDKSKVFPKWKINYIKRNRQFYNDNKEWLDKWIEKIREFDNSHMKFEWNVGDEKSLKIKENIVQFRASGIRIKKPTYSPALNLVGTQVPILPWIKLPSKCIPQYTDEELAEYGLSKNEILYGRYLSVKEAARLQGMDGIKFGNEDFRLSNTRIYEALGNAVNTKIVLKIARNLIL